MQENMWSVFRIDYIFLHECYINKCIFIIFCWIFFIMINLLGDKNHSESLYIGALHFQCSECGFRCSIWNIMNCFYFCHWYKYEPNYKKITTGERHLFTINPYQCIQCDTVFSMFIHFRDHSNTHTGETQYHCEIAFSQNSQLIDLLITYNGERPYHCDLCDRAFPQNSDLIGNIMIHTGERSYQCSKCGKAFSHNSELIQHMRKHTGRYLMLYILHDYSIMIIFVIGELVSMTKTSKQVQF